MRYFGVLRELGLLVEQRLEHRLGVVHAQADADRNQKRHVAEPRHPVLVNLALADDVEIAERHRRREKQRHVDEQHLVPAHLVADHHRREHQDAEHRHQQVVEVRREVEERLGLDRQRQVGLQNPRQQLLAGLNRALRPAVLLRLEGVHLDRHFGRRHDVGQEDELPAAQLRAIAQVEVFGQRVVLPAAGVADRLAAPHAGRAVEIEEAAGAVAAAVLEHEVAVEQNRLDLREQRVILVDVPPARLHHADLRVGEVRQQPVEEVAAGRKSASKMAM